MLLPVESMKFIKAVIGVVAIVNPLGAIPVFLSLAGSKSPDERSRIARVAAIAVGVILILSAWIGESLLSFFGITISALRIGGGLLIVLMSIDMLHSRMSGARHTDEEAAEAQAKEDIAVVPLAIPLMAGPGAISLVIVNAHQAGTWGGRLLFTLGIAFVAMIVWAVLHLADPLGRALGVTGLNIATRIMGLLLAAIGVQFMVMGLLQLFPGLS